MDLIVLLYGCLPIYSSLGITIWTCADTINQWQVIKKYCYIGPPAKKSLILYDLIEIDQNI